LLDTKIKEMKQIYGESRRLAQSIGFVKLYLEAGISPHNGKTAQTSQSECLEGILQCQPFRTFGRARNLVHYTRRQGGWHRQTEYFLAYSNRGEFSAAQQVG
jgi:hypothetical protein